MPIRLLTRPLPLYWLAGLAVLPLLVWWLGWYPGFASPDTIDQWTQVKTGNYTSHHPPIHTLYLEVFSLGGRRPGLVTMAQILLLGAILVYAATWLSRAGVPTGVAVAAAWLLGLSPAVAPTTLALWKDVLFGLFLLWAWIELTALAVDEDRVYRWPAMVRLGLALSGVFLLRANGPITVLATMVVLSFVFRRRWRHLLAAWGVALGVAFLVLGPLYQVLGVEGSPTEPAQVFLADVAASYVDQPDTFSGQDIELLESLAPLGVWTDLYDCYDSTPLLFDPRFDHDPVRADPGPYRRLVIDVLVRDLDTVAGHRLCAANFVYWPPQPAGVTFHRIPYFMPENDVGLVRDPLSVPAFRLTNAYLQWAELEHRLWLTWRPAIVILPALLAIALMVVAVEKRRLLIPSTLFLVHLVNVVATSPAQEFRYAYPLYLVAVLTIPLLIPTLRELRSPERGLEEEPS